MIKFVKQVWSVVSIFFTDGKINLLNNNVIRELESQIFIDFLFKKMYYPQSANALLPLGAKFVLMNLNEGDLC